MQIPNNFDLRSLQVFVTTADQGGMTQGAKVLRMTQSAVSQIIAGLEAAIGVKLFDRSVRPIALTSAGRSLLERGRQIISQTKEAFRETRTCDHHCIPSLTIAMSDNLSAVLSAHLFETMNALSSKWRFWSGHSTHHREGLLSHDIDLLFEASDMLGDARELNRHIVLQEPYVLVFPKGFKGNLELDGGVKGIPFLRFSKRLAMGRHVEGQLNRLRLKFPNLAEFDCASNHSLAVGKGLGWGITTPLALLESPQFLPHLNIQPLKRGAFSRRLDVFSRDKHLGEVPEKIARESTRILTKHCLPTLYEHAPWLKERILQYNQHYV